LLKKTFLDITHPDDRAYDKELIERAKSQETPSWTIEKRYIHKDGSIVWVEVNGTMMFDPDGQLKHSIASISDITVRKLYENALKTFNEELESRVTERTAELRDKDEMLLIQGRQAAMGEMIGNIAHQWRQPLNTLGLFTQRLGFFYGSPSFNKEFLDTSVVKSMEIIQHMSKTIDDFRNYFKPDKEKVEFNLSDAIANTVSLIDDSFKNQNIRIDVNTMNDTSINGYQNEFAQVILNILNNARDAFTERKTSNPRVTITISNEGSRAIVTISDNAGGIPEEIIGKIFDPYFTTKGPQVGTGVGLFMSKTIIEKNMNGRLTACNCGNGAEFKIEV
jgi:signal transduction histidine kinase